MKDPLSKAALKAAVGGAVIVLALDVEMTYVFPNGHTPPLAAKLVFYSLIFLSTTLVCFVFLARGESWRQACPRCGQMDRPHFLGGEGGGPILYRCENCREIVRYEDVMELKRKSGGGLDPDGL